MGQSEILQILKNNDRLTTMEITELSDTSLVSIQTGIRRLLKDVSEDVQFRQLTTREKEKKYGRKIGCKINVYWLDE